MSEEKVVFTTDDVEKNKTLGIVMAIFPILFFLPLVSEDMKKSELLKFRANQSCVVLCLIVILNILKAIIGVILGLFMNIPVAFIVTIFSVLNTLIGIAIGLVMIALYVMNIVSAAKATDMKIPLSDKINLFK